MHKKKTVEYLIQILLLIVFVAVVVFGYVYKLEWVGVVGKNSSKTLWDWMELLIIPFVLTIGLWLLNKKEKQDEEAHDLEKFQESALQHYLDKLSDLMINKDLKNQRVREVARARTFVTLKILDGKRKGLLLIFCQTLC